MNLGPCPHCGIGTRQSRSDGRCVGCGRLLPDELRAPPEPSTPLPDEAIYRDALAELLDRAKSLGYGFFKILNDLRARQLILELHELGGSDLLRLIHDRTEKAVGRVEADELAAVWNWMMQYSVGKCGICRKSIPHSENVFDIVNVEIGRRKQICQYCSLQFPVQKGAPTKPWWKFW